MKKNITTSIQKKLKLLIDALNAPEKYSDLPIAKSLTTQSALAKFSDPKIGIFGCSLNSFKSASDLVIPGGFSVIDNLRKQVLKKLDTEVPVLERTDTVRSLQQKNNQLAITIRDLEEYVMRLSHVHRTVMHMYERIAHTHPELVKPVFFKDRAEIYTLISALELTDFWEK